MELNVTTDLAFRDSALACDNLRRLVNDPEDLCCCGLGFAEVGPEGLSLASRLRPKHHAEDCHESRINLVLWYVAVRDELSRCVVQHREDSEFEELRETENDTNDVALADCNLVGTFEHPVIVCDYLLVVSERGNSPVV